MAEILTLLQVGALVLVADRSLWVIRRVRRGYRRMQVRRRTRAWEFGPGGGGCV